MMTDYEVLRKQVSGLLTEEPYAAAVLLSARFRESRHASTLASEAVYADAVSVRTAP